MIILHNLFAFEAKTHINIALRLTIIIFSILITDSKTLGNNNINIMRILKVLGYGLKT